MKKALLAGLFLSVFVGLGTICRAEDLTGFNEAPTQVIEIESSGAVAILHNREEYTKLMEDLAGTRYLVDSMRANNHDFTNKLHVIMGLIQMEDSSLLMV